MPKHIQTKDTEKHDKDKGTIAKPVDVATLEKSKATSGNDPENSGPVAAGEASG